MAELPLEGVRVLDLCLVWAGPFATMLLGDLGAEVIKVENPFVFQPMTRGMRARPRKESLLMAPPPGGAWPDGEPGGRPWNYNPVFVQLYRNKKSFTVDLRRPEGMEILARLVAESDAVIENNATGTLERLGITYDWLRGANEKIVMVRLPAYGSTGPYAEARALGVHLESVMGHTLLRGYEDLDPSTLTSIFSGDYLSGALGAFAVMMGVWHCRRTGAGQLVEIGQAEAASSMFAQAFMDYSLNGRVQTTRGNRSVHDVAPYGVYPCQSPGTAETGEDRWIAITITSDAQWQALCEEMGQPDWATASELKTQEGRLARQDFLDERLSAWTVNFEDYELFHRLQAAGIPAAPVLEASRVYEDPHVAERGLFAPQTLFDGIGPYTFTAPFFRFPETPVKVRQAPVAFGEHNEYVYKEVIGVSDQEYDRLREAGHIAVEYDRSVP